MRDHLIIRKCAQGSDEWDNLRRPRLTGSKMGDVISSRETRKATAQPKSAADFEVLKKRAKKQFEVYQHLCEFGTTDTSDLNDSALRGLVKKGFATIESSNECSLKMDATRKAIDKLECAGMRSAAYPDQWLYTAAEMGDSPPTLAMDRGSELEPLSQIEFENQTGLEVENVGFVINPHISMMVGVSPDGLVDGGNGIFEQKNPLPHTHRGYLRRGILPSAYKVQVHAEIAVCEADYGYFFSHCFGQRSFLLKVYRNKFTESLVKCLKSFEAMYTDQLAETAMNSLEDIEIDGYVETPSSVAKEVVA